jgi:hypothetical protein
VTRLLAGTLLLLLITPRLLAAEGGAPCFSRHVEAVFSRLGCNSGGCHGAVKGQAGFRLSLFAGDPAFDHERILREYAGRRINPADPESSLLLRKAIGQVKHEGGKRTDVGSSDYEILRRWIAAGAAFDTPETSKVVKLQVEPAGHVGKVGERYPLKVQAHFADNSTEDVTTLCAFESLDSVVAAVGARTGMVEIAGAGDATLVVRYRGDTGIAQVLVPRVGDTVADTRPAGFIDKHVLAKLQRLKLPPAGLADDATFLRRASLDVAGELPTTEEVRKFLADTSADKRARKIDEMLQRPGYAALWTMKFCDLLKASEFGVYADGMSKEADAPRFAAWVRSRIEKNLPYDQFAEQILTATSREGRSLEEWAKDVVSLDEGYTTPRTDLEQYSKRKTLDLYWQRRDSGGVPGALQVAHTFLGLRLECAQCHRHPHDIWQQDDLLSFANFFMQVRQPGFQGDNEKKFPEVGAVFKKLNDEAKKLGEDAKKLRDTKLKPLDAEAKKAKTDSDRLTKEATALEAEAAKLQGNDAEAKKALAAAKRKEAEPLKEKIAEFEKVQAEIVAMEKRAKLLPESAKRLLHAEVADYPRKDHFASVTSPIGTQKSMKYRLLGEAKEIMLTPGQDPRTVVAAWMRRPDNPYFAKAIVNRIWAHYFGRGIVDPPDHLSAFNPPTHPELLAELTQEFIKHGYDLRWLHQTILNSRTYQQESTAPPASAADRANYAAFYYRRLPAEVLLDALNQATGTREDMEMKYHHWPNKMKTVEVPFTPKNAFVTFMLEQFGRPERNSASQCDCERDSTASVLQVLSFANHPRVWQKIGDEGGLVAKVLKTVPGDEKRIEEIYLAALSRLPSEAEQKACLKYLKESPTPAKGIQGVLWSLLNTREFLLQH